MANDNAKYLKWVKDYLKPLENKINYSALLDGFIDYARFITYAKMFNTFYDLKNSVVLDAGCGTGGMSIALRLMGAKPIGFDIDETSIKMAKARIADEDFLITGGFTLPFSEEKFDCMSLIHVIEHVTEPQLVVNEASRVLKKNGILLMECPNRFFPIEPHQQIPLITLLPKSFANIILKIISKTPIINKDFRYRCENVIGLANFVSYFTLKRFAEKAGFQVVGSNEVYDIVRNKISENKTVKYNKNNSFIPLVGDWNGNKIDSVGLFDKSNGMIIIFDPEGNVEKKLQVNEFGENIIPIVGDWNGDEIDSIGLYDKNKGTFNLDPLSTNSNLFSFGLAKNCVPLAGDWNGDGIDTVGVYDYETQNFYLKNQNTSGNADLSFTYGADKNLLPIIGDWIGHGFDTIGLFDKKGIFQLRYSNSSGPADWIFTKTMKSPKSIPLVGDWDGDGKDTVGYYSHNDGIFHLFGSNIENKSKDSSREDHKPSFFNNLVKPNTLVICKKL